MGIGVLRNRLRALEAKITASQHIAEFVDRFEAEATLGIVEGRYCPSDMPDIVTCFRKWVRDGVVFKVQRGT
ncbi:MAG: hypothetical protein FD144_2066 [Rhodospirillaceae bacterium]|nr:MAG: hypothetical protein FD144_2066 [Rhodospirillaceae bacterium]